MAAQVKKGYKRMICVLPEKTVEDIKTIAKNRNMTSSVITEILINEGIKHYVEKFGRIEDEQPTDFMNQ